MHQKSVELADPLHDYPRVSAMVDCTVEWVIQFEYKLTLLLSIYMTLKTHTKVCVLDLVQLEDDLEVQYYF